MIDIFELKPNFLLSCKAQISRFTIGFIVSEGLKFQGGLLMLVTWQLFYPLKYAQKRILRYKPPLWTFIISKHWLLWLFMDLPCCMFLSMCSSEWEGRHVNLHSLPPCTRTWFISYARLILPPPVFNDFSLKSFVYV